MEPPNNEHIGDRILVRLSPSRLEVLASHTLNYEVAKLH